VSWEAIGGIISALWLILTKVFSWLVGLPLFGTIITVGLGALLFLWQLRRNMRFQVYMEAVSALYEADRLIAVIIKRHIDKQSVSPEEHKETLNAFSLVLGRIGKLHLVGKPRTVKRVNSVSNSLTMIIDGYVQISPDISHIRTEMQANDIRTLVDNFITARAQMLTDMRKDMNYEMRSLRIVVDDFVHSFLRNYGLYELEAMKPKPQPLTPEQEAGIKQLADEMAEEQRMVAKKRENGKLKSSMLEKVKAKMDWFGTRFFR
jgi:hypothetical protein